MNARGEQGVGLGARRDRAHVDHLGLPAPQGVQVARQSQGIPDRGAAVDPVAPDRGQPLHLLLPPVEEVHDRAGDAEELSQPAEHRLRDGGRRGLGDDGEIDVVQDLETLRLLDERLLGADIADGERGLIGEALQEVDLPLGERPRRAAAHRQHADHHPGRVHGDRESGHDPDRHVPGAQGRALLESAVDADVAGPDGASLDRGASDETEPGGDAVPDLRVLLRATGQGDRREGAVGLEEPDHRAVDPQETEHALRDSLSHRERIEALADQAGHQGQLAALVLLPRGLGLEAVVLDDERYLVGEGGEEAQIVIREAATGPVGDDEASDHRAADADRRGGERPEPLPLDQLTGGRVEPALALAEDVRRATGRVGCRHQAAERDVRDGGSGVGRARVGRVRGRHASGLAPVRVDPVHASVATTDRSEGQAHDPLRGLDEGAGACGLATERRRGWIPHGFRVVHGHFIRQFTGGGAFGFVPDPTVVGGYDTRLASRLTGRLPSLCQRTTPCRARVIHTRSSSVSVQPCERR